MTYHSIPLLHFSFRGSIFMFCFEPQCIALPLAIVVAAGGFKATFLMLSLSSSKRFV